MISVVTVTYGDRAHHIATVVRNLLATEPSSLIARLFVVDNASSQRTQEVLKQLAREDSRLTVIPLATNEGSAGGFATGIRAASETQSDFVLLLDDDNVPCPSALEELVEAHRRLGERAPGSRFALLCTRWDQHYQRRIAMGEPVEHVYPRTSSYCGFHVLDLPRRLRDRLFKDKTDGRDRLRIEPVQVPYGPYGGLFMRRDLIAEVERPDRRYFTYADDFDFTYKFASRGIPLVLVPACRLRDIDTSWSNYEQQGSALRSIFLHPSDARVFLSLRNQILFEKQLEKNPILYAINRFGFVILLLAAAARYAKPSRLMLALRALYRGEKGSWHMPEGIAL